MIWTISVLLWKYVYFSFMLHLRPFSVVLHTNQIKSISDSALWKLLKWLLKVSFFVAGEKVQCAAYGLNNIKKLALKEEFKYNPTNFYAGRYSERFKVAKANPP